MKLEEAIKYALDGEAILFLGAGFSYGGINKKGGEMKVGADLSHAICDDLGVPRSDNLTISSSRYLEDDEYKKGLSAFIDFLKAELECISTTNEQDIITKLPWKRVYTTNYDNIVEMSSRKQGILRSTITITNERYTPGRTLEQAIIHINGYINKLNEKTFFEEFKITDDNYNRDGLLQSSWRKLFEADLMREKTIIFIGYSLQYDQELVRCIANLNIKSKCMFIDIPTISADSEFKIKRYGELCKIGVSGFAKEIENISATYKPCKKVIELFGFEKKEIKSYYCEKGFSSVDVVDLLVKGELKTEYINQTGYCISRKDRINRIIRILEDKKIVILQSKLGNGKSVFLECLSNSLLEEYSVYFVKNIDNYIEDLQILQSTSDSKNVLLVDDYGYYIKLIKDLGENLPDNLKLVLTCRTAINLNLYYDLIDKYNYNENDIFIEDLDDMTDNEIYELIKLFNKNRFWGEFDRLNSSQKKKIIKRKYGANVSKIFYLLMNSEPIKKQIEIVMEVLEHKLALKEFVMAQAINSLCRLKFSYSDLCEFVHISDSLLRSYIMDQNVREIIDVEKHRFILSSSIFAQYLVRQGGINNEMIEMLGRIYKECSENDEWNKKYIMQRKYLVSRSNIRLIFSPNKKLTDEEERKIFKYFDSIKNLPTATDNPFFWLQFGITSLNLKKYEIAKIHFDNAYANVNKMEDFDSYQIDTHYARLLLCFEMKTNRNCKDSALINFDNAHRLLFENSNVGIKLNYVLRQTELYKDYYDQYKNFMTDEEKQIFIKTALKMTDKFQQYFNIKELNEMPVEVSYAYRKYRQIFIGTEYEVNIKLLDTIFNKKVRKRGWKV
ncbi:SIR2 family protein [Lachnospiraceae bacterium 56-18]